MKREFLEGLGLEKEVINKIMSEHGKDVGNTKSKNSEQEGQISKLQEQIKERDSQLEELKKSAKGNEELQQQINQLQKDNQTKQADYEQQIKQIKIDSAIEMALSSNKAKNLKAAKALLNLSEIELKEDGSIKGLDTQIKALKEEEASKFLFDAEQLPQFKGFTPVDGSDGTVETSLGASAAAKYNAQFAPIEKKG